MEEEMRKYLEEVRQIRIQNMTINERTNDLLTRVNEPTRKALIKELHRPRNFIDDDILELRDEDFEDHETWLCTSKQEPITSLLWETNKAVTTDVDCASSTSRDIDSFSTTTHDVARSNSGVSCTSSNSKDVDRSGSSSSSRFYNCVSSHNSSASLDSLAYTDLIGWLRQDADNPDPEFQTMRWSLVNNIRTLRGEPLEIPLLTRTTPTPATPRSSTATPRSSTATPRSSTATPRASEIPRPPSRPSSMMDVTRIPKPSATPGAVRKVSSLVPVRSRSEKALNVQVATAAAVKKRRRFDRSASRN